MVEVAGTAPASCLHKKARDSQVYSRGDEPAFTITLLFLMTMAQLWKE